MNAPAPAAAAVPLRARLPRRRHCAVSAAVAVIAAGGAVAVASSVAAGPAAAPLLVHDVAASRDRLASYNPGEAESDYEQPDTQIEPSAAVNPANPLNVVIAYQEGRIDSGGDATNGYATSFDGGLTWTTGELPGLTNVLGQGGPFERASDAVVAFGPGNVVYANSLVFDQHADNGLRSGIAVNVSHDGGRTWSAPVFLEDEMLGGTNDKNWIVVDTSDAPGHTKGRVYVVWDRVAPVVDAYCDSGCDQLANWTGFQTLPGLVFPAQGIGSYPVVLPDGSLGVVLDTLTGGVPQPPGADEPDFQSPGNYEIVFIKAPLAGSTPWPAPLTFLPPIDIASYQSNGVADQRAGGLPAAAVDPSSGQIYTVWEDDRFRSDGNNDVVLSTSTDGGVTWTPTARVSAGPAGDRVDHYNPSVAVGAGGTVHIAYRQRAETGTAPLFQPYIDSYYQESTDAAKTFTAPLRLDAQPSNAYYGAFSRGGTFEGDYDEVASAGGYTYFVRCQAAAAFAGEAPALTAAPPSPSSLPPPLGSPGAPSLQLADSGRGHQHQVAWVALVREAGAGVSAASSFGAGAAGSSSGVPASPSAGASEVPAVGLVNTSAGAAGGGGGAAAVVVLIAAAVGLRRRRRG